MSRPAWLRRLVDLADRHDCDNPASPHPATSIVALLCVIYGHDVTKVDDVDGQSYYRCRWCGTSNIGIAGEGLYRLEHGNQTIMAVHPIEACDGQPCPIHNRSAHLLRGWPQHFRDDRGIMERLCPHGIGDPDPDHLASVRARFGIDAAIIEEVHGCDGCCCP